MHYPRLFNPVLSGGDSIAAVSDHQAKRRASQLPILRMKDTMTKQELRIAREEF